MSEDNSLPDEIISEILSPALKVPDKKFANTSDISPFTEYSQSPSAYLLVCKSWLRVATPLLYNVVVLRSKAQAKALGQALSKNKDLGQFIKHLRVEGGYGAPMRTILKAAPNITDLCLSFEILASDNTTGLCDGLASIRPRRLIVLDNPRRPLHNKMIERLADAVAAAIPQWQQLTILHCPNVKYIVDRPGIVEALVDARRLRELTVKLIDDVIEAYSVLQDCPLRSIQVTDPVYPGQLEYLNWEDQSTSLKEITKYETYRGTAADTASSHVIPAPPFPFTPMASEPQEVQDNIWSRVLYFLLSIPLWTGLQGPDSRLPFLLVSKTFYRLGLPHYYTHVVLIFSESVSKFTNVLESNPSLGQHVRTIVVGNDFSKPHHDADSDLDDESDPMLPIMSKMTGLTKLWGCVNGWYNWGGDIQGLPLRTWEFHVSWDAFLAVVNSSGRTLHEISIPIGHHPGALNPTVFAQLDELRSLTWICSTEFALNADNVPVGGLSKFTDLRILRADASFLDLLARMELPALQRVKSAQFNPGFWSFLRSHGSKLVELDLVNFSAEDLEIPILEVCPNIRVLYLYSQLDQCEVAMLQIEHFLTGSATANSLEKLILRMCQWKKAEDNRWASFFSAFESTQFPQLNEIQSLACRWPKKERDISKSKWVRWSEILLEQGINLTDATRKKWRPRLK